MSNKHIATGAIPVQELVDSYSLLTTHYSSIRGVVIKSGASVALTKFLH